MPGLLSLANELITNIANELDTRKGLRGTCRRINAVVSPRVFSYIIIDIHADRLDVGISQLEALATGATCVAEYVRKIDIRHLSPNYSPSDRKFIQDEPQVGSDEPKRLKVGWAQEKMRELLPEALSTLKGATTAIWKMCYGNPYWASVLVSEFLGTLPALDTLHLMEVLAQPKLRLDRISNLTKLTVRNDPHVPIAEIIANSPRLTHLDLLPSNWRVAGYTATLHSTLKKVPRGRPLRLEHLRIGDSCVRLDHETLPHLRHLRSLELKYMLYIPVNERQTYRLRKGVLSTLDRFGSSPTELWGIVGREGIPLEAVVAPADDGVIDYLASVTGIKKICLLRADTDALANRFFTQVVPRHSETLVTLSISADFEGLWCFGKHNVDILLKCTQLSELSIAVGTSTANGKMEVTMDGIVSRIMGMATQMPNLCRLQLFSAAPEMLRNAGSGNSATWHDESTREALCKSITSFGPIDPAIHPNLFMVGWREFRQQRGADGVIKYVW
ncbi:hypothetical protein BD779DRAFT_627981 [Infundibulicybe gibba]|nr:hypothetical protein BD779DRAFT_627981 [Infundibulicybe gibba]